MKSKAQLVEEYIDEHNDRDWIEKLTIEEQALQKCLIRDTLSFTLFSVRVRLKEALKELFDSLFGCNDMDR